MMEYRIPIIDKVIFIHKNTYGRQGSYTIGFGRHAIMFGKWFIMLEE
jgi:hypothetical protein